MTCPASMHIPSLSPSQWEIFCWWKCPAYICYALIWSNVKDEYFISARDGYWIWYSLESDWFPGKLFPPYRQYDHMSSYEDLPQASFCQRDFWVSTEGDWHFEKLKQYCMGIRLVNKEHIVWCFCLQGSHFTNYIVIFLNVCIYLLNKITVFSIKGFGRAPFISESAS